MSIDHLSDLASLTKVCATTFGIMILIDDEQILYDDLLATYSNGFTTPEKQAITVRHMLTHTAGLV